MTVAHPTDWGTVLVLLQALVLQMGGMALMQSRKSAETKTQRSSSSSRWAGTLAQALTTPHQAALTCIIQLCVYQMR